MSSEFYYAASEDFAEKKKIAGKIEKGLKRLLIIVAVIISAQLIWLFGVSAFMPFSSIDVHGFSGLQRADILAIAGINDHSSFFSTNVNTIQERLLSNILVESAIVIKRFPDSLSIFLNPREAAAITLTSINSKQVPMYIDRHGVFYKIGDPASLAYLDLPVISGFQNPQLNMRLPITLVSFMENLKIMSTASPELLSAISEIRIEPKTLGGYELVLFPVHSSIRVRIENNLNEQTLRYVLLMLNVFENDINKPHEIDFRSGMGSYRIEG
jgi:cell division protein FtsQ